MCSDFVGVQENVSAQSPGWHGATGQPDLAAQVKHKLTTVTTTSDVVIAASAMLGVKDQDDGAEAAEGAGAGAAATYNLNPFS